MSKCKHEFSFFDTDCTLCGKPAVRHIKELEEALEKMTTNLNDLITLNDTKLATARRVSFTIGYTADFLADELDTVLRK